MVYLFDRIARRGVYLFDRIARRGVYLFDRGNFPVSLAPVDKPLGKIAAGSPRSGLRGWSRTRGETPGAALAILAAETGRTSGLAGLD